MRAGAPGRKANMVNMDKPEYQELAARIELYRDEGYSWTDAQAIALADMKRRSGWTPS